MYAREATISVQKVSLIVTVHVFSSSKDETITS